MMKTRILRNATMVSLLALTVAISACSSDDDDSSTADTTTTTPDTTTPDTTTPDTTTPDTTTPDTTGDTPDSANGGSEVNPNLTTLAVVLDSATTVPPANVDGAQGSGSFSVDPETGAVAGSVTVSGTTGVPSTAHIHTGAAGEAGPPIVTLLGSENGTIWTVPADAALDAAQIALFEAGELYINVHTAMNAGGELRAQLVDAAAPSPGSLTISFTNTSATMPMTPPVVALHNAPGADNGIRLFEVGQPALEQVIQIAENGNNDPLVELATAQIDAGTVTAAGVAAADAPGPLTPGASSSITLDLENDDQVLSIVSMIVCSNDGFSGIDSRPLSTDATDTFTAPIYDAGSENNVLTLDYWVPPCGGMGNIGDEEDGSITAHPGQAGAENADFDFEAGTELLEITVTRN